MRSEALGDGSRRNSCRHPLTGRVGPGAQFRGSWHTGRGSAVVAGPGGSPAWVPLDPKEPRSAKYGGSYAFGSAW